jgi:hypothetical protein
MHINHAVLTPSQSTRCPRNEKVRGSSPLSSTNCNMALTRSFVLSVGQQGCRSISRVPPALPWLSVRPERAESEKVRLFHLVCAHFCD